MLQGCHALIRPRNEPSEPCHRSLSVLTLRRQKRQRRWHGHPSGVGTGYVGTIDGVEVFTTNLEDGHSYVFSALMRDLVSYRLVTPDAFVSVEFEEGDNPWSGTVIVRFAQQVLWRDTPVIDLVTEDALTDEETPTPA